MACKGFILLDDHRYKHFEDTSKCQSHPSKNLCLSVSFQEALTKHTLVETIAITESVPVVDEQTK